MNKIQILCVQSLLVVLCVSTAVSQTSTSFDLSYTVNRVYPSFSVAEDKLCNANNLSDLNRHYQADWVKEYVSVEVTAMHNGEKQTENGSSEWLTEAQKELILKADLGTDVSVDVHYLPDNNLSRNEIKKIDFTFTIDPLNDAKFKGGEAALKQFIQENAMSKISEDVFKIYQLTAVKFTIDEEGEIQNASIVESSKNIQADATLLSAINQMPKWEAATFSNGKNVKQEFVLTVGDMSSCVINTLHIRR